MNISRSAKAGAPDPAQFFSPADLARSWAEVTGEAWESILHRLGDWAITDAFPDDAFLTDVATGSTFHTRVIFDRMRWHRDLVDKIRRVQDCKERDRLQKFADNHIQAAEIALVRRDVVVEACRAMNVAPPPVLGLVEGVSAEHRVPPESPLHSPVGVFAREADQDQELLRHRDVMPADEAEKYALLWDAAAKMSRVNGHSPGWNWLQLMDAFWRANLSPEGLVYFYPGRPGWEYVVLDRTPLGGSLLGHRDLDTAAAKIEKLRQWAVADYLGQPAPFGDFFREDPEGRVGLAVLTQDLVQWRQGVAGACEGAAADAQALKPNQHHGIREISASAVTPAIAPGPKGGAKKVDELAWDIALRILESEQKPKRGHGRLTALARMVEPELSKEGHKRLVESICKAIRPSLREWEAKNPDR